MGTSRRLSDTLVNIILVAGLVAIWISFAPVKMGGQASYVIVKGISMEPGFHGGDLVIIHQANAYQVGDIITYHDAKMEAFVIHRIIDTIQDRFIIKGDNNTWIDDYEPTSDEILGKLWIHLPKMGLPLEWLRSPIKLALAAGLLGGLYLVNLNMKQINKKDRKKIKTSWDFVGVFNLSLYAFGILALISLVLSVFAFSRPVMRAAEDIKYTQAGVFSYTAAGASEIYDTGSVQSGEPVFTNLTCTLNLKFLYILQGQQDEQLENITGVQRFYATVLDQQSGWQRTIPLTSDTTFTGIPYTSSTTIDLCEVQDLVSLMENQTGVHSSTYTLDIVSRVSASGRISGQDFTDLFEPKLTFKFNSLHFYFQSDALEADPIQTIQPGSISNPDMTENTLKLLGLNPTVRGIRVVSVFGLLISLGGLLALGIYFIYISSRSQDATIRIKYGSILMDIYDEGLKTWSPVIEMGSIDDLAKVAEHQNSMIMHLLPTDNGHHYLVQIEGTTYHYGFSKDQRTS